MRQLIANRLNVTTSLDTQKAEDLALQSARIGAGRILPSDSIAGPVVICLFVGLLVIWSAIDHTVPNWDSACHLLKGYQCHDLFREHTAIKHKLMDLMHVSTFYPPLVYWVEGLSHFLPLSGQLVDLLPRMTAYSLACIALYKLASHVLEDCKTAAIAVALFCFYPGMYGVSHAAGLLDVPLVASVFVTLWSLQAWRTNKTFLGALLAGVAAGLAILTKQSAAFFIAPAYLYLFCELLSERDHRNVLVLSVSGLVAASLPAPWFIVNFADMKNFIATNRGANLPDSLLGLVSNNARDYALGMRSNLGTVLTGLFLLSLFIKRPGHKQAMVAVASVVGCLALLPLAWVPGPRYLLPALGWIAIVSAAGIVQLWDTKRLLPRAFVACVLAHAALTFYCLNFTPYPLPQLSTLERNGIVERDYYDIENRSVPGPPMPYSNWADYIFGCIQQRSSLHQPTSLCVLAEKQQVGPAALQYLVRMHDYKIGVVTFATWTMKGFRFDYTPEQFDSVDWFLKLEGSPPFDSPWQKPFCDDDSVGKYQWIVRRLKNPRLFERVGRNRLPDGSFEVLYKRLREEQNDMY